jgi:epidermal growth factor receptor substrate 15
MYFIQGSMGNPPPIPVLPPSLPPFLVDAAAGRPIQPLTAQQTGSSLHSPTFPSATTMSPQYTGILNSPQRPQTTGAISPQLTGRPVLAVPNRIPPAIPARPSTVVVAPPAIPGPSPFPFARPPAHAQPAVVPWDIQPAEKATYDGFFKGIDQQGLGYVEGAAAVPFMLLSNLPDAMLAKVW